MRHRTRLMIAGWLGLLLSMVLSVCIFGFVIEAIATRSLMPIGWVLVATHCIVSERRASRADAALRQKVEAE